MDQVVFFICSGLAVISITGIIATLILIASGKIEV